jgi:hypothetical protein
MELGPHTRFTMCSLYSREGRAVCACFLGKGKDTVKDLARLNSEALLWSGAGSGVISLADLEAELYGKRSWDPEGRDDREFIQECHKHGIKVFGVVFTAQGYEVEVELDESESQIVSFGKITGRGKRGTWGLREFYQERYPEIYGSFRKYHSPERLALIEKGIENSDFLEQCACRDIHGNKSICYWVNSTGMTHDFQYTNYFMCKNSPGWREHLKTIVEMQIDAGFDGVQFDEPGVSFEMAGTRAGFCHHCNESFKRYMIDRHGERFRDFNYPEVLKKHGAGIFSELAYFKGMPYWRDWKRSLVLDLKRNFSELVDHARAYAEKQGREIYIAANFFNWMPHYLTIAELLDVFSLEYDPGIPPKRTNLIYPEIGRAIDATKPVTMVPHIAFAAHLRDRARRKKPDGQGKDVNILRYLTAEAAFAGGDPMVPYSCLCITGHGAYYPPVDEISGYLKFVIEHRQRGRNAKPLTQACVVLSFPSYFWSFDFLNLPGRHFSSLEAITHFFQALGIQYRIMLFGDDDLLADKSQLFAEEFLILPNVSHMTDRQVEKLREFVNQGGKALLLGRCGNRDPFDRVRKETLFPELRPGENKIGPGMVFFSPEDLPLKSRAASRRDKDRDIAKLLAGMGLEQKIFFKNQEEFSPLIRAERVQGKILLQILNPNYNYHEDAFIPIRNAELFLGKDFLGQRKGFRIYTPEGLDEEIRGEDDDKYTRFHLPEINIYALMEES